MSDAMQAAVTQSAREIRRLEKHLVQTQDENTRLRARVGKLEDALRKLRDGMRYDPQTRTYSVSEAGWFSVPYTFKSPDAVLNDALAAEETPHEG